MARRRAMMGTVVAIVVSGPQATGKTTLAMALGTALSIPVFSRDPLMRALQASLPWPVTRHGPWVPATGLGLQTALLARQLELGQSAILECIAPLAVRQEWRRMCLDSGCRFVSVECTCPDADAHRARFEQRPSAGRRCQGTQPRRVRCRARHRAGAGATAAGVRRNRRA